MLKRMLNPYLDFAHDSGHFHSQRTWFAGIGGASEDISALVRCPAGHA